MGCGCAGSDFGQWSELGRPETSQLLGLLKNAAEADFPTHADGDYFFEELRKQHRVDRHDEVLILLSAGGWNPLEAPPTEDQRG
jgi:hypothetical protein